MIDTINWSHGDRVEQVNYINVGGYTTLRLYGLLDREMFIVSRNKGWPLWQGLIPSEDWVHLSQERPIEEIREFLSLAARSVLEVGGEHFTNTLRSAMQHVRTDEEIKLHIQNEPKDRLKVRNIAIDLDLYELPYIGGVRGWQRAGAIPTDRHAGRVEVPCHIEKIIDFRNNIYPFINNLTDIKVREDFVYLTKNWPSGDAVQLKHRELQMSQQEREQRERQEAEEVEAHEGQIEAIRDRFRVAFGDQRGQQNAPEDLVEADDPEQAPPDPAPEDEVAPCRICQGDFEQCDCCLDCDNTEDNCNCWECGECGEHNDDCVCNHCGTCGHHNEDCLCCSQCDAHPCECQAADTILTNQGQTAIEQLRQKVNDVLGD
jgi:hypothetical protein